MSYTIFGGEWWPGLQDRVTTQVFNPAFQLTARALKRRTTTVHLVRWSTTLASRVIRSMGGLTVYVVEW